jgi:hypothetical protein
MDTDEFDKLPASMAETLPVKNRGKGRPPGRKNNKTLVREKKLLLEVEKHATAISNIDPMDPLAVMENVMASRFRSGDLAGALAAARELAPYRAAKLSSIAPDSVPLSEDLLPDPPPTPDQRGPDRPIL